MAKKKTPPPPGFGRRKKADPFEEIKKARKALKIPEASGEEEAEEQRIQDEKTMEAMKVQGLIAPPPLKPWKALSKDAGKKNPEGRPVIFETAGALKEQVEAYFEQAYANPLYKSEFKEGLLRATPLQPLLTITGLCIYLGVGETFWRNKRKEKANDSEFSPVFEWADHVISQNKFQGAALGFFKENIIAREMGLKDHVVQEVEDKRADIDKVFPLDLDPGEV